MYTSRYDVCDRTEFERFSTARIPYRELISSVAIKAVTRYDVTHVHYVDFVPEEAHPKLGRRGGERLKC